MKDLYYIGCANNNLGCACSNLGCVCSMSLKNNCLPANKLLPKNSN